MDVKNANTGDYEKRDVVMPGIGLYRTQAARTGQYAGMSSPAFGPDKTLQVNDFSLVYPEWCEVTVKRLVSGVVCEFPAREYWTENYATKGRDSKVPNAMWQRRPRGQIAKCAEAQALRKAFPEVGAAPTAEEMEGKSLDDANTIEGEARVVVEQPRAKSEAVKEAEAAGIKAAQEVGEAAIRAATGTVETPAVHTSETTQANASSPQAQPNMLKVLRARMAAAAIEDKALFQKFSITAWEQVTTDHVNRMLKWLQNPSEQ
jgi:phage recombination protein Bet